MRNRIAQPKGRLKALFLSLIIISGLSLSVLFSFGNPPMRVPIASFTFAASGNFAGSYQDTFVMGASTSASNTYYVSPTGDDINNNCQVQTSPCATIQHAVDLAQPGETIVLAPGTYLQDIVTKANGLPDAPITITGPRSAVVKGGGNDRIFEINHDYIDLTGFAIDGLYGSSTSSTGYRDKLIYALGKEVRAGVVGLRVFNMIITNASGECIRLRYFAQYNEIYNNTIGPCGIYDFRFNGGGKNGEGVYIGTAPEQLGDGKNPTTDPDQSNYNWVHHNIFDTEGNECVDIKEGAEYNVAEYNDCTGQKDPNSGGMDSRGNNNVFRYNMVYGNIGAGVRLGGDTSADGINNDVYSNTIGDNQAGGIRFMRTPQGTVCGNIMNGNTGGDTVGTFGSSFDPTAQCTAPISMPLLTVPGPQSAKEGTPLSFSIIASDPDSPPETLSLSAMGLPKGASFVPTEGVGTVTAQFSWNPTLGQAGDYAVTFSVTDSGSPSHSDSKTVAVSVLPFVTEPPENQPGICLLCIATVFDWPYLWLLLIGALLGLGVSTSLIFARRRYEEKHFRRRFGLQ